MAFDFNSPKAQYAIVTSNYWVFTLTDGALRMLVLLYFYQAGYTTLALASMFILYEAAGIFTNLVGGWLGARWGLNKTMHFGLALQIVALGLLLVPQELMTVVWVMGAQALSGIAKDLNKMSAKSSIKLFTQSQSDQLFNWVALLTGSKNALKGVGFFLGGLLLTLLGFESALILMMASLFCVLLFSHLLLKQELGKLKLKPKFKRLFAKTPAINVLSIARIFLFGARDVWFVVALPVYLSSKLNWSHWQVGAFLATWIIGYGVIQATTPKLAKKQMPLTQAAKVTSIWAGVLACVPIFIAAFYNLPTIGNSLFIVGLCVFGAIFAVNSAWHSFLIVHYAEQDGASLDVGFYYMANAIGRLIGTIASGWIYQSYGMGTCLIVASVFLVASSIAASQLPKQSTAIPTA